MAGSFRRVVPSVPVQDAPTEGAHRDPVSDGEVPADADVSLAPAPAGFHRGADA